MLYGVCWGSCAAVEREGSGSGAPLHSRDMPSEPLEAPMPGCDSGGGGGSGSTTMSKSDTFQGPGGFRTPSAPRRVAHHPTTTHPHTQRNRDITKTDRRSTDTWQRGETEGNHSGEREVREDGNPQNPRPGGELSERSGRKETVKVRLKTEFKSQVFHAICVQCVKV